MYPLFLLLQGVAGLPVLQNVTVLLPVGTSYHGPPGLLCTPATWTDVFIFYVVNYAAHAVTTRSLPGEQRYSVARTIMMALFFPAAGAFRGILGIASLAVLRSTCLEKAASAGALCMVIRTPEWKPQHNDELYNTIVRRPLQKPESSSQSHNINKDMIVGQVTNGLQEEEHLGINKTGPTQKTIRFAMYNSSWREAEFFQDDISESELRIQGSYKLPPGYTLSRVPRRARFIEVDPRLPTTIKLPYNYNLPKILVSLGQAIYAIFTLYRTRGDQISQFGYAAFGLTVAPYIIASVLNLLGSVLCPEFPAVHMVESSIMEEARRRGDKYIFKGTVGTLDEEMTPSTIPADAGGALSWIHEPVKVSLATSGEIQVRSESQLELSCLLSESGTAPKTITECEPGSCEQATTDIGNASDDRLENKGSENLRTLEKEETLSLPADSKTRHVMDCPESQPTTAQSSKASDPYEKLLLAHSPIQ
jgi:hypothetical protein